MGVQEQADDHGCIAGRFAPREALGGLEAAEEDDTEGEDEDELCACSGGEGAQPVHVACSMWHVTCGMWHAACGMQHLACAMCHVAYSMCGCGMCICLHGRYATMPHMPHATCHHGRHADPSSRPMTPRRRARAS